MSQNIFNLCVDVKCLIMLDFNCANDSNVVRVSLKLTPIIIHHFIFKIFRLTSLLLFHRRMLTFWISPKSTS